MSCHGHHACRGRHIGVWHRGVNRATLLVGSAVSCSMFLSSSTPSPLLLILMLGQEALHHPPLRDAAVARIPPADSLFHF